LGEPYEEVEYRDHENEERAADGVVGVVRGVQAAGTRIKRNREAVELQSGEVGCGVNQRSERNGTNIGYQSSG
jgi:hypothetical protein